MNPYRQSPEIIERVVQQPCDCKYKRCKTCQTALDATIKGWNYVQTMLKDAEYINFHTGLNASIVKHYQDQSSILLKTYNELILRTCEHK